MTRRRPPDQLPAASDRGTALLLATESFTDRGGGRIDMQAMDVMGSTYLLTHGLAVRPTTQSRKVVWRKTNAFLRMIPYS